MGLDDHRSQAPERIGFAVLTISDTRDLETDRGGAFLVEAVETSGHQVVAREIVIDSAPRIAAAVSELVRREGVDLVLTTGGTGIAPRDVTYDTLREMFDSEIPGFGELFRWLSYREVKSATILSRATAGVLEGVVVLVLPGSPKALRLAWDEIIAPEAGHLVSQVRQSRT